MPISGFADTRFFTGNGMATDYARLQKMFCPLSRRYRRTPPRPLPTITLSYLQKEATPHPQRKIHPGYCNAAN
jgi:hypothetical protein